MKKEIKWFKKEIEWQKKVIKRLKKVVKNTYVDRIRVEIVTRKLK